MVLFSTEQNFCLFGAILAAKTTRFAREIPLQNNLGKNKPDNSCGTRRKGCLEEKATPLPEGSN